jgi:hypothetical protein
MLKKTFQNKMNAIKNAAIQKSNTVKDTLGVPYRLKAEDDAPKNFSGDIRRNKKGNLTAYPNDGVLNVGKKIVTAPLKVVKKQWNKNQSFRNKNSTRAKFEQNSK